MTDLTGAAEAFLTAFGGIWSFLSTRRFALGGIAFSFVDFIIGSFILYLTILFIKGVFFDE